MRLVDRVAIALLAAHPHIERVITHVVSASNVTEAFAVANDSQLSGKVLVSLWQDGEGRPVQTRRSSSDAGTWIGIGSARAEPLAQRFFRSHTLRSPTASGSTSHHPHGPNDGPF